MYYRIEEELIDPQWEDVINRISIPEEIRGDNKIRYYVDSESLEVAAKIPLAQGTHIYDLNDVLGLSAWGNREYPEYGKAVIAPSLRSDQALRLIECCFSSSTQKFKRFDSSKVFFPDEEGTFMGLRHAIDEVTSFFYISGARILASNSRLNWEGNWHNGETGFINRWLPIVVDGVMNELYLRLEVELIDNGDNGYSMTLWYLRFRTVELLQAEVRPVEKPKNVISFSGIDAVISQVEAIAAFQ